MSSFNERRSFFAFMMVFCLIFSISAGCSKEAKKERHWNRGEKYFSKNKFKEAIIEYKNVVQIDPKDPKAHYKLGLAHLRTMQFREAFSEFSKSVELDSDMIDARLQLGNLYLLSRDKRDVCTQTQIEPPSSANEKRCPKRISWTENVDPQIAGHPRIEQSAICPG